MYKTVLAASLTLLFVCNMHAGKAAAADPDTAAVHRTTLYAFPFAFFTPETNWGFGAASIYPFSLSGKWKADQPSQVQLNAAYTLKNQILIYIPFEAFLMDDAWRMEGEAGYYSYSYRFYGIGGGTHVMDEEIYRVNFPRFIVSVTRRLVPSLYAGLRYWFDGYDITETEQAGLLSKGDITGSDGGINSGVAARLLYDSRDNTFSAKEGFFA